MVQDRTLRCIKVFCDLGVPEYEALCTLPQKGLSIEVQGSNTKIGVRSHNGTQTEASGWDLPIFLPC